MFRRSVVLALLLSALNAYGQHTYRSADGARVRRPHVYRRHPNSGTAWTARCRDGSVSFSHTHAGTCSHHGGVGSWH